MAATSLGTVAVTGSSGFIGGHLCRRLREHGIAVRVISRGESARSAAGPVTAPFDDRETLARALRGADAVVHLAARVHVMRETSADAEAAFHEANVAGTRRVLAAASEAGVGVFALASSVKAVGESTDTPWTGREAARPASPYGRSKLAAELAVREDASRLGIRAPVLRLPLVYGPGMKGNMLRLFDLVWAGWPLPVGAIRNRRSLAYVGNVAAAFEGVLRDPEAGATYYVRDDEDVSTPHLARLIGTALGRPARIVSLPASWFRAAGRLGDALARRWSFPLTSAAVERLIGSLIVSDADLVALLGPPPFGLVSGLEATARWYRGRLA